MCVSEARKMKAWLALFVFFVAVSEIRGADKLKVTVYYETLCPYCLKIFKEQIWPAYKDPKIRNNIYIEMVPYGKANITNEDPFTINCQHGEPECFGNVEHACFIKKNQDNYRQVAFVSCTMSEIYPPSAGPRCTRKLGYSYKGVEECTKSTEGNNLQITHEKKTKGLNPPLRYVPTVAYDDVYVEEVSDQSRNDFKAVVLKKLKEKGIISDE